MTLSDCVCGLCFISVGLSLYFFFSLLAILVGGGCPPALGEPQFSFIFLDSELVNHSPIVKWSFPLTTFLWTYDINCVDFFLRRGAFF